MTVHFDRGRCAAGRHHPESAGDVPAARGGFLYLPGRCAPAHRHASGQAGHRVHTADVEVALRRCPIAVRHRPVPPRSAITLSATPQPRARLRGYGAGGVATGPVTAPPATPQCRRGLECRTGRERIQITPMSLEVLHSAAPAGLSRRPERIVRQSHRPAYAALGRTQVRIVCRSRRRERGVVASAWSAAGVVCEMVRDLLHQHARDIQAAGRVLFDAPSHRTRGRQIEPRRDEVVPEGPERPVGLDLRVRGEGEPLEGFAPGLEPPPRSV